MSSINNISSAVTNELKAQTGTKNSKSIEADKAFEEELLRTVEKLEMIGTEIDQVMEQAGENPKSVSSGVNAAGKWINNIAGLVENISGEKQDKVNSTQKALDHYQKNIKS